MSVSINSSSNHSKSPLLSTQTPDQFFLWREFAWGAIAGAFGEGIMHPVDTIKTRIQSQAIFSGSKNQKSILQMVRKVWMTDGLTVSFEYRGLLTNNQHVPEALKRLPPKELLTDNQNAPMPPKRVEGTVWMTGFYRGILPGVTGSLATGATYFGVIESTKKWIDESHPNLGGHWAHFIAGAIGDTLGSFIYVPCEVMKQRMQVQGSRKYWNSVMLNDANVKPGLGMYNYYSGMLEAGCSIWKEQGPKGLYAGYWSTLARDVPFAGLMVTFYEAFKSMTEYGKQNVFPNSGHLINSSVEGLLLGGLAGGLSAYLTTPLDVIKTRLQVQGPTVRYNGWRDAVHKIWLAEGPHGMFRGSIPRIMWYIPASALTFMAVEFLRDHFNKRLDNSKLREVTSLAIDNKGSPLQETS